MTMASHNEMEIEGNDKQQPEGESDLNRITKQVMTKSILHRSRLGNYEGRGV